MSKILKIALLTLLLSLSWQLGGWREVNVDLNANDEFSRSVVDVFSFAIDHMRDTKIIPITYAFHSIVKVRTQLVAGMNWNLILALKDDDKKIRHYDVTVWQKLPNSEEKFKVTAVAEIPVAEEPQNEPKRELVGGYNSFACSSGENSGICTQLLAFVEPKLRNLGILGTGEAFSEIIDSRRQVVAGMNYKLAVNVSNSGMVEKVIRIDVFQALPNTSEANPEENRFSLETVAVIGRNTGDNSAIGQYNPFYTIKVRELEDMVEFIKKDLPNQAKEYENLNFLRLENLKKKNIAGNVFKFSAVYTQGASEALVTFSYVVLIYPPYVGHEQFKVQSFERQNARILEAKDENNGWAFVKVNVLAPEFISKMEYLAFQIGKKENLGPEFVYESVSSYRINPQQNLSRVIIILQNKKGVEESFEVTFKNDEIINYKSLKREF